MTKEPQRRLPIDCDDDTSRYDDSALRRLRPKPPEGIDADGDGSKSGADVERPEGGDTEDQSSTRR